MSFSSVEKLSIPPVLPEKVNPYRIGTHAALVSTSLLVVDHLRTVNYT